VDPFLWAGGALVALLALYLTFALLFPERLS
jgi:K+-transporting ATPase KdpF subunit